jgi:RNA polymerase sigma-54 factor
MKLQRDFLDRGPIFLKPLTLRDVAEEIEMHESTVSRVTSGKYVYTPHGIFELKYFFNSGLNRDGGEDNIASKSVKEKIREIIVAESGSGKRLSDQELMRLLRNQGIRIARRTVTKYRGQLGLLAASKRKQIF